MIAALLIAALQQDVVLDAPVYDERVFGVSIPRPFEDWVFFASSDRGTATVFFQPRSGTLSDQLWGAVVITTLPSPASATALADRRIATAWRPQFGSSFRLLSRDTTELHGLPAARILMGGSIDRAVLEVEEWIVVRGGDLIAIQFRYPRGVPRDSLAAGYRLVLDGLAIRGAPALAATADGVDGSAWHSLRDSPWTAEAVDATVRLEARGSARAIELRLDLVNDGAAAAGTVALWFPEDAQLDSARAGPVRAVVSGRGGGRARRVMLRDSIRAGSRLSLSLYYRLNAQSEEWLPEVQPARDSAGHPRRIGARRTTLRFDLPETLRGVTVGRLSAEVIVAGRRRQTWNSEDDPHPSPPLLVAAFAPEELVTGGPAVYWWRAPGGIAASPEAAAAIGASVARAWPVWWRAFGPIARSEVHLVDAGAERTRGYYGLVVIGADALEPGVMERELARTWWGGAIRIEGDGSLRTIDAVIGWSAARLANVPVADTAPGSAMAAATAMIGEPRMREALRSLAAAARGGWLSFEDVAAELGPRAAAVLLLPVQR